MAILERRRTRRYRISRKERKPIEEQLDTVYSGGGYSTAEDLKNQEYFPHRYKLRRSVKIVPKPAHPRSQPHKETHPKEVIEITPVETPPVINPRTNPKPHPVPDFRVVTMDQQIQARAEELAREMVRRGDFQHLMPEVDGLDDDNDQRRGHGHGNRGRGRGQPRQDDRVRSRNRSLRYPINGMGW